MSYRDTMRAINRKRRAMLELRAEMRELQAGIEPEAVADQEFSTSGGKVRLSDLFGAKDTLILIHNMGKSCVYCTQWADGFNGLLAHLEDRAAFVLSSPDAPEVQKEFADSRGWKFRMVSHQGSSFARDLGYTREENGKESFWPGVSMLKKTEDGMVRVSDTTFGPGDDFNPVWNLLEMLPEGAAGWEPKYSYDQGS